VIYSVAPYASVHTCFVGGTVTLLSRFGDFAVQRDICMKINQQKTAQLGLIIVLFTLLFPPWQYREPDVFGGVHSDELARGLHYSFVTHVPYYTASLNTAVLGIEISLVVVLSLLIIVSMAKANQSAA